MPIEFLGTPRSIPSPRAFSPDFPDAQMGAEQFYRAQNYNIILPVNTQNTCLSAKPAPERDFTIRIASPNENSPQSPTPSQAFRSDIIELSLASAPDFSYLYPTKIKLFPKTIHRTMKLFRRFTALMLAVTLSLTTFAAAARDWAAVEVADKAGATVKGIVYAGVGKRDKELRYAIGQEIMAINQGKDEEIQKIAEIVRENMEEKGAYSCEQGVFYQFCSIEARKILRKETESSLVLFTLCVKGLEEQSRRKNFVLKYARNPKTDRREQKLFASILPVSFL